MTKKRKAGAIARRLGPVGLSVIAAAITAAGFAAISLAAGEGGGGTEGEGDGPTVHRMIVPGPGGPLGEDLSAEDRQRLEEFRQCLGDQGAEPPRFDPDNPPEPPSSEQMERIRKAHEACMERLPENLQERLENLPGPHFGGPGCGPGEPPPARNESGENQEQGFVVPAPAPSGSAS
jgi:hypothetical protein